MTTLTEPKPIDKLPKWARMMLRDAERRASDSETALKDYLDAQTPSHIYTTSGLRERRFIQDDRVTFKLPHGEITVSVDHEGVMECHASYGSARLLVIPHVTNVVHLEIQDEHRP